MILEMKVPSPGESISEVEIAQWLVKNGDYVKKDQPIAEVDSDKATLELPAEKSGIITLKAEEGDTIAVGSVVCLIDTEGVSNNEEVRVQDENVTENNNNTDKNNTSEIGNSSYAKGTASPAAKKILTEKEISSDTIKGSGKDGRITKEDALKAMPSMGTPAKWGQERTSVKKKMSLLRRKVGERLVAAKNETAMLTTFNEVDMSAVFNLRNKYKAAFEKKHQVKLGFMSFFTKAIVRALKIYPDVNSMIDGKDQVIFNYYDISVAVSSPKGLVVPVVRNAESLSFLGIEKEIKHLASKARDGQITVDEMTGGTFTISNGGVFGSMLSTPIINPPQSGILGMHNIIERPIAVNGKVVIHPMMYLAFSYDHRIIDGKESVGFLVAVKEGIEDPLGLLMENDTKKSLEL